MTIAVTIEARSTARRRIASDCEGPSGTPPTRPAAFGIVRPNIVAVSNIARYDGLADWYDANVGEFAAAAGRELVELLGPGTGCCLDLGCGTGINLGRLAESGWSVVGVDISVDQLRVARQRVGGRTELIQADATALPFADESLDAIASSLLHTDVGDFALMCREAFRVLKPGGRFAYVGTHPCFVGPFARNPRDQAPELRPGYGNTAWTTEGFGDGIRRRVGVRHVPLAEFLNAFLAAGLRLVRVSEANDEDFPTRVGVLAERPAGFLGLRP